ncbi:hypothetical protein [Methylocaldum sp.]|uniref:hypothetical protein n=1 Tax=Methylocaldum sp. TaxID=1969727 RepID=UPI002D34D562|nr:hypothetical protein [Methylocaldum sp.]HYE34260.1 hypothetical protein [Methylocaldum sp.]
MTFMPSAILELNGWTLSGSVSMKANFMEIEHELRNQGYDVAYSPCDFNYISVWIKVRETSTP